MQDVNLIDLTLLIVASHWQKQNSRKMGVYVVIRCILYFECRILLFENPELVSNKVPRKSSD